MLHYVQNYVDACKACQVRDSVNILPSGYLQQIVKHNFLDAGSLDHLRPFHQTANGEQYLTVAVEKVSIFVVVRAVRNTNFWLKRSC